MVPCERSWLERSDRLVLFLRKRSLLIYYKYATMKIIGQGQGIGQAPVNIGSNDMAVEDGRGEELSRNCHGAADEHVSRDLGV